MELFRNKIFLLVIAITTLSLLGAIVFRQYVFIAMPFVFIAIYLLIYHPFAFSILSIISVSVSVPVSYFYSGLSFDFFIPSEPLLFGVMVIVFMNLIYKGHFDKAFFKHPITISVGIYLLSLLLTTLFSTMPLVSFKYLLVRLWFIVFFYYFAYELFKRNKSRIHIWIIVFIFFLLIPISYALGRQLFYGIELKKIAYWAAFPFFKDHTSYGALLAMYIPFLVGYSFSDLFQKRFRFVFLLVTMFYFIAIVFSYTRAAWVSLVGAFVVFLFMKFRLKFRTLILLFSGFVIILLLLFNIVFDRLEQNKQESSLNFVKHFQSISNISNDASNLERINRWKSAYRMFLEKPIFGFGPGTYMFKYAPFQMYRDKTIISTNSGDLGNAHSEYLGALSESGIIGFTAFVLLVFAVSFVAIRSYYRAQEKILKMWIMGAFIGLVTYFLHSIMNNFLDIDKIALPFWSFMAIIVYIDIQTVPQKIMTEIP